ncbi:MAG TPA: glycosyltransferase [Pirellulales bacterium]
MSIGIYILNFNGRDLLEECLPSVLHAADFSRYDCTVTVVDNASTDDSLAWLAHTHPQVAVVRQPNWGLCSYNSVLADADVDVALLLNNDIRLAEDCIDLLVEPLVDPIEARPDRCFMTAPHCLLFDNRTYEGFRTAVQWRWGLVRSTALFPGHEPTRREPGLTASAGAALAVDRREFVALGGFDPLYLPGRLEDLDFAFRGYQAGGRAEYVPTALAFHRGQTTFNRELGAQRSHLLALRNTLLFQWKNLRHPWHLCQQIVGLTIRLGYDLVRAPSRPPEARLLIWRALLAALARRRQIAPARPTAAGIQRERQFFQWFHPARMALPNAVVAEMDADDQRERRLAERHPISRWYVCPLADYLSRRLAKSPINAAHCTLAGLAIAMLAGILVLAAPQSWLPLAALAVLAAWFCDRLDGPLARRQRTSDPRGAWLDANSDELVDLGLHVCVAARVSQATMSSWPWLCLVGFVCGKYLLMYGLGTEPGAQPASNSEPCSAARTRMRWLYHLPGNADVRAHLLALGLATGCLGLELALVAVYYNVRWLLRYAAVVVRPAIAWEPGRGSAITAAGSR